MADGTKFRRPCLELTDNSAVQECMSLVKVILAIVLPPLAVLDKGLVPIVVTIVLTILGWIPGTIAAIYYNTSGARRAI
jgi:uncharacterized membrane protein YqaE (UPF0057 family)